MAVHDQSPHAAGRHGARARRAFPAAAQDNKRVIVGTWGGDYSRLLTKNIETPLLAPKGWECVHAEENADPRKAKMLAEKSLRRGTTDVQGLSANDMYDVEPAGPGRADRLFEDGRTPRT